MLLIKSLWGIICLSGKRAAALACSECESQCDKPIRTPFLQEYPRLMMLPESQPKEYLTGPELI